MREVFSQILNMSLTGSVVILLVLLARFVLKRSPKIFSYALWSVVLFRLLCPVSLSAPVSVLEVFRPEVQETSDTTSMVYYLPAEKDQAADFTFVPAEDPSQNEITAAGQTKQDRFDPMTAAFYVWLAGIAVMFLYSAIQYSRLRMKLIGAMLYRGNVYLADHIGSPFVLGVISPKIYLPSNVPAKERKLIIAHERHHIRRLDHIIKLLAYMALCIHWFNPLVWAAFILAGKDMEMSCDEAVIKQLGSQIRADYSAALLRLATHRKIIAGMPLAFGEGDTKGRVMNMAKWKKPKLWVSILCLLLCLGVLAACAVNPTTETSQAKAELQTKNISLQIDPLPAGYSQARDEDQNILFTDGTNTVGGVICYSIPAGVYDPDDRSFLWLEEVGIPDFEDPTLLYSGGMTASGGSWLAEFVSDVPEAVNRRHYFYPVGNEIYDIWFDMLLIDYETIEAIRTAIKITEPAQQEPVTPSESAELKPAIQGNAIVTDLELVQYGALKLILMEGYDSREQDGAIILSRDGVDFGGITCYSTPDFALELPDNMSEWVSALGLPENKIDPGGPIAQMIGNSPYGDLETEFFYEPDPTLLNSEHHFFIDGNLVYDVYYDQNIVDHAEAKKFLDTVQINNDPVVEENPEEDAAFEKCLAVMDAVANGSYSIVSKQTNAGNEGPSGYLRTYLWHEGDFLNTCTLLTEGENITETGDYYSRHAWLYAGDSFFTNEGHQGESGDIVWAEAESADPTSPWLGHREWNKTFATYMGTFTDENGECLMFRYDRPYEDREDYTDSYFIRFYFDPEGNFLNVEISVNLFLDNEFTVTESIASMDPETVNAEIQREYQRAIG